MEAGEETLISRIEMWFAELPDVALTGGRDVTILVGSWLLGGILGSIVTARLTAHGFEKLWRAPWNEAALDSRLGPKKGNAPAETAGLLVKLTLLGYGILWVARLHGAPGTGVVFENIIELIWTLSVLSVIALIASRLLAKALIDFLGFQATRKALDACFPEAAANDHPFSERVLRAIGSLVYCAGFVLVFIAAAEIFEWGAMGKALAALWQFALRFAAAAAVLLVGWIALRWVRAQETTEASALSSNAEARRMSDSLKAGAVASALLLAVMFLNSRFVLSALILLGIVVVAAPLLGFREYLSDALAGFFLWFRNVEELSVGKQIARLEKRGFLISNWRFGEETVSLGNKVALDLFLGKSPIPAGFCETSEPTPDEAPPEGAPPELP